MLTLTNPLDGYQKLNLDDHTKKVLEFTDQNTSAKNLIIDSAFVNKESKIKKLSIYELKQCLSICLCDDKDNSINKLLGFDYNAIPEIIKSIRFYERQVLRQLCEVENISENMNIFYNNYEIKYKLVELNIFAIIDYFTKHEGKFIWGNMDERQKSFLIRIVMFNECKPDIKKNFIDTIANYTCLKDYPNYQIKTRVLERFTIR